MILFLLACSGPSDDGTPDDTGLAPSTVVDTDTDTDAPMDTDDPVEPPVFIPEQLDCGPLPDLPETFTLIQTLGPHEDFTFDTAGGLVGVDGGGNLISKTRDGDTTLLAPNIGEAKGTRYLRDGSIIVAQPGLGQVARVMPSGEVLVFASITASNGIAIDAHGNAWIATANGRVERVTPDGDRTVAAEVPGTLDGITFSPDFSRVYFNSEFGTVRVMDVEGGEPVGEPTVFVDVPLGLSILDGMTTDSCGNLYVSRMSGHVFRYTPDGEDAGVIAIQSHPGFQVTPALNFGSGVGGFERDHLYVMNFLGGVLEVDIGLEGRWEPHFPIP